MIRWSRLALALCLVGCRSVDENAGAAGKREASAASSDCLVISFGDGDTLTLGEVERLARAVSPARSGPDAVEWAIDVTLANWDSTQSSEGGVADEPVVGSEKVRIANYGEWLKQNGIELHSGLPDPDRLKRTRDDLRRRAKLTPGPCYQER